MSVANKIMEYKAKLSHLKISPRKVRLVAGLIRGKNVEESRNNLKFSPKRSSEALLKLLNSAISNAKNIKSDIDEKNLFIKEVLVDEGPKLKRFRPVARGRAHEIQKKTSHITLVLSEQETKSNTKNQVSKIQTKNKKEKKLSVAKK